MNYLFLPLYLKMLGRGGSRLLLSATAIHRPWPQCACHLCALLLEYEETSSLHIVIFFKFLIKLGRDTWESLLISMPYLHPHPNTHARLHTHEFLYYSSPNLLLTHPVSPSFWDLPKVLSLDSYSPWWVNQAYLGLSSSTLLSPSLPLLLFLYETHKCKITDITHFQICCNIATIYKRSDKCAHI